MITAEKDRKRGNSFNLTRQVVVWIIIFIILSIPFFRKIESQDFHGDENYWFIASKYFKLFFVDRDFRNKAWEDRLAYEEPPVGPYIIGLALSVSGYGDKIKELGEMRRWDFLKDYDWNVAAGAMPPKEVLCVARLTMAILGILTCLLIYWIGKKIFNARTGLIAALLLAYNPLMLSCSSRAMTDAPLLFFLTVNLVLMVFFYRSFLKNNLLGTLVFSGLIGINIALAAGTKLNGALNAIIFGSFCIFVVFMKTLRRRIQRDSPGVDNTDKLRANKEINIILISLLIAGVTAISVFTIMNPYLYDQPLKGSINMVTFRMELARGQQELFGGGLTSLGQKAFFVIYRTLFPGNNVILGNIFKVHFDFLLFLLGLGLLLYGEAEYLLKNYRPSLRSIILIWIAVIFAGTIGWIPLDWDRYYLPVVPCIAMMMGFSIDRVIAIAMMRLNPRLRKP